MHPVAEVQATPISWPIAPPGRRGVGWIAQLLPSHRSATGWAAPEELKKAPVAMQVEADVQATVFRNVNCAPPGLGVGWTLQVWPFHRSARLPALEFPAAMHAVADVHATPLKKPLPWGGLGVAWIDHRVPSHRSASGPAPDLPTAVHADAEVQNTPFRLPP